VTIKRRKEANFRKEIIVTLRINEEESEALEEAVKQSGMTQSDILRTGLRGVIKGLTKGFKKFLAEVEEHTAETVRKHRLTSTNGNGHK